MSCYLPLEMFVMILVTHSLAEASSSCSCVIDSIVALIFCGSMYKPASSVVNSFVNIQFHYSMLNVHICVHVCCMDTITYKSKGNKGHTWLAIPSL